MATVDGATHIVRYGNPAFCQLMEKPLEQLVGRPLSELLPERDACFALLDRVFRLRRPEQHTEDEDPSFAPVFWSYTMWPVVADELLVGVMIQVIESAQFHRNTVAMNEALVLGSVRQHELTDAAEELNERLQAEIVERELVEKELRESEERYRSLFASAPMAVFVCDREAVIQQYNDHAAELWGRHPVCGSEKHCGSLSLWLPDGTRLPHDQSPMVQVLETGRPARNVEVSIERPDGKRLPVLANFAALRDARGEIAGAITSFVDITERRLLEDALLARASELARADRSKDEFLAMLAHELRNPLAPLRNATEVLASPDASDEAREEANRVLFRQTANMTHMIDDLLDVSRITEGKIELRKAVVPLERIVAAAAELARPGIEARGQVLTIRLPAEPVFLDADETRLDQVFGNLLTNACKYSDPGAHISLIAERAAVAENEPPIVVICVRDNGMGITPELMPHIFDLFVQATRSLDRAHGGLGIGLTLVQRLVKLHGGSVEARSDGVGQGSTFIVRLPILAGSPAAAALPPPAPRVPRERPRRMLIVDDNEDSAQSMAMVQRLRGHETRTAFTGPAALAAAIDFLPEVVLLDIGLPEMDGYEVARRLRAMPAMAGAFVVAMSGYGRDEDIALARQAGMDEYLVKPVDLDQLREWLRTRL
jgi:PAS domain S-box-containing protein